MKIKLNNESDSLNDKKAAGNDATQKEVQYPQPNNSLKNGPNVETFLLKDLNILDLHISSVDPSINTDAKITNTSVVTIYFIK